MTEYTPDLDDIKTKIELLENNHDLTCEQYEALTTLRNLIREEDLSKWTIERDKDDRRNRRLHAVNTQGGTR